MKKSKKQSEEKSVPNSYEEPHYNPEVFKESGSKPELEERKVPDMFACPYCFRALDKALKCPVCDFHGWVDNEKVHLHRIDYTWAACLEQVEAAHRASDFVKSGPASGEVICGMVVNKQDQDRARVVHAALEKAFFERVPQEPGYFLEIGAAPIGYSSRLVDDGWCGYGLDIDAGGLVAKPPDLIGIVADAYYVPFLEGVFDFVFDRSALHHFKDLGAVLAQVCKVLKPGGIYLSVGNHPCPKSEVAEAQRRERDFMQRFGLIETMPTEGIYLEAFRKLFKDVQRVPVEDNTIWSMRKG